MGITKLVKLSIKREADFIASCKTSAQRDNPQVVEMRLKCEGRLEAFEAVLDALHGSFCFLRIWAGK